ncbi:PREDICTED: uncharacterized protein LOC108560363 [Nicrophorus vespilloides]|uniref:Uncharacterized protein LOC108560363 n=1 Tax=Nicrophorus vespilloides TaxID=110193 RepID=A0ABM1MFL9_NICVS|nr:PREDICTED: uncharacterized protein LOC108560363 [Nicrophorus vespilloides]
MAQATLQDLFELQCVLRNVQIIRCARVENGVKQLLALVTSNGEIVLHYTFGELPAVIKRIPWLTETAKSIEALCFDPFANWLLVVTQDSSLYIIPALSLVDKKQKVDCKWSLSDVTHFSKHQNVPEFKPKCVIWWQTLDCNQNALVGYENGNIALISLTDGRCIGVCSVTDSVRQLYVCQDNSLDSIFLLINGESGQQWRLVLEHHSTGYQWPPDAAVVCDDSTRSRLYSLKQMGVDKLVSLKQRIVDGGKHHSRRNSQTSDTASESSHSEHSNHSSHSVPELLPHLCDTYFSPQYARSRYLFCAFYKPSSLLTVHTVDVESAPLYVHKLPPRSDWLLLTDKLIYIINSQYNAVSIVSAHLSECKLEGDSEFNEDSLIGHFSVENERILNIYKVTDTTLLKGRKDNKKEKSYSLPKTVDELNIPKMKIDTCVIVTNNSVYRIIVRSSPIKKFITFVNEDWNLIKAERLALVFGLNMQQLFESCGDLLIGNHSFHQGLMLYKQSKVHLLKRVLKLAVSADCKALLKYINLCLSTSKVDMSMATKIHIGNLAVMAHTEMVLRHPGHLRTIYTKDFMTFLCYEEYYDQVLAVNVACQAGHWNVVTLLARSRGLQPEVVAALSQVIQSARSIRESEGGFLYALSEPCLTQSLLIYPSYSLIILHYVRNNLHLFPVDILRRFTVQLDPSQPCALPVVSKIFQNNHGNKGSGLDSTLDSVEYEPPSCSGALVKEFIECFILVVLTLIDKDDDKKYDISLLEKTKGCGYHGDQQQVLKELPRLHPLSCGYEHAAVVRNNCVYTMGLATSGCLGLGPLLTQSSSSKLVQTLADLKVKVISVSCGRRHTLALTNFGVYAWGSNAHGQLGLGSSVQESPYPQMITTLFDKRIVDVEAGQYHSTALTVTGQVYTWGWGIHGQLGHGTCNNEFVPRLLDFNMTVKQTAAGHAHTLILTSDGKTYGFGSNLFGQLGSCNVDSSKTTIPIWVLVMPDIYTPIERISTAYFHNVAVRADQEVYTWGANPQEVRMCQSKFSQKLNVYGSKPYEPWKASLNIYSSGNQKSVDECSVGYRHSALLHGGKLLWGCSRDGELCEPKIREQDLLRGMHQKFMHVSCGPDFIMAVENCGKVLAWGNNHMAQTILGKSFDDHRHSEGKVVIMRNTKRIIKIPSSVPANSEGYPVEVPGLPTLAINYGTEDEREEAKRLPFYAILTVENRRRPYHIYTKPLTKTNFNPEFLCTVPHLTIGQRTLHYVLETYHGHYDAESVLSKCLELRNHQAASKLSILDGHFGDSLAYQLQTFKSFMDSSSLQLKSSNNGYDLNILGDLRKNEFNGIRFEFGALNSPPQHILSSSSSLDSIRQWGDDLDHQGGRESPCQMAEMGDIKQSMTQYVQSVRNDGTITTISKVIEEKPRYQKTLITIDTEVDAMYKDARTREVIKTAALLVEFYIRKTYNSENHILMQNILLKCIEFWLNGGLPVTILEMVLLKNMDKYFYPLSILLFCKNFNNNLGEEIAENERPSSARFLKEFSTKFCLELCSMVLENVNKA